MGDELKQLEQTLLAAKLGIEQMAKALELQGASITDSHSRIQAMETTLARIEEREKLYDVVTLRERVAQLENFRWFILGASALGGAASSVLFKVLVP